MSNAQVLEMLEIQAELQRAEDENSDDIYLGDGSSWDERHLRTKVCLARADLHHAELALSACLEGK